METEPQTPNNEVARLRKFTPMISTNKMSTNTNNETVQRRERIATALMAGILASDKDQMHPNDRVVQWGIDCADELIRQLDVNREQPNSPLMEQEFVRRDKITEIAWEAINRLFEVSDSLDKTPVRLQEQLEALNPTVTRISEPEEPVSDRIKSLAEDVLKLHRPDEQSVWARHGLSEPTEPPREPSADQEKHPLMHCRQCGGMVAFARELERELNATHAALEQMTRDAIATARDRDEIQKLKEAR
jgi:hypothetical protein